MKYALILFLLLIFALSWFLGLSHYFNLETLRVHQQELVRIVADYYLITLLLYFVLYVIVACCSIPATAFIAMTGGFLFDQWMGTFITVAAATCAAMILFLSVKLMTQHSLMLQSSLWVKKMRAGFQRNAFTYLLMLRLTPIFPFFAVNLAAALLHVPLRIFFWGTLLGMIPLAFIYTSLGSALQNAF